MWGTVRIVWLTWNTTHIQNRCRRLVKFIRLNRVEQQTPTDEYDSEIQGYEGRKLGSGNSADLLQSEDVLTLYVCPNMKLL